MKVQLLKDSEFENILTNMKANVLQPKKYELRFFWYRLDSEKLMEINTFEEFNKVFNTGGFIFSGNDLLSVKEFTNEFSEFSSRYKKGFRYNSIKPSEEEMNCLFDMPNECSKEVNLTTTKAGWINSLKTLFKKYI